MSVQLADSLAFKPLRAMTAESLTAVLEARIWKAEAPLPGLTSDSRTAGPKRAFFALQGQIADGHSYLDDAVAQGAPALFLSDPAQFARLSGQYDQPEQRPTGLAAIYRVASGREALADLAAVLYGHPSRRLRLLGVTGTNGKTTVTHLVVQLLEALGQPAGMIGTLGMWRGETAVANERTTPESPDLQDFLAGCVNAGLEHVAMEVSSIGIALARTRGLFFSGAAFTNLTQDHLDFHGSLDEYEAQKQRLFIPSGPALGSHGQEDERLEPGAAVLNLDDPAGRRLEARLRGESPSVRCLPFSMDGEAALTVRELKADGPGWRGSLVHGVDAAPFHLSLPGIFNVANLLAAVGLLRATGVPLRALAEAASHLRGAPGRFERVPVGAGLTAIVDYAHTPDALANLLREARKLAQTKGGCLHVLFGCGGDRDRGKRPQMGRIAEELADVVMITDDNPRTENPAGIQAEIRAGLQDPARATLVADRREAIHGLLEGGNPGDVLVVAGKGHEPYQEVGDVRHPFDDRQIVRDWAAGR